MRYIAYKRFKDKAICGRVNIPAMTVCEEIDGIITYNNKPLCVVTSENAHKFFVVNEDDFGMERGALTQRILKRLSRNSKDYDALWDKVWDDALCGRYRRREHNAHWLWNHAFYNAEIGNLKYIANLIGA